MSHKKSAHPVSARPVMIEALESRKLLAAVGQLVGGIDPYNMGKGEWIWNVASARTNTNTTSVQGLIDFLKARGIKWIVVKAGDGNNGPGTGLYSQFNKDLITRAHNAGMKVMAYHIVYGGITPNSGGSATTVAGEKAVIDKIMAVGPDGLIFKAQEEWEKLSNANSIAEGYGKYFRDRYPTKLLGHAPLAYADLHSKFPYQGFGKYADVVMPQMYWKSITLAGTPEKIVADVDVAWKKLYSDFAAAGKSDSIKPLAPIGQGHDDGVLTQAFEVSRFFDVLRSDPDPASPFGYNGISFWSAQHHNEGVWQAIANGTLSAPTGSISGAITNDLDGDSIKDINEGGVAGRIVYDDTNNNGAFDAHEPSVTTNSQGNFTLPYRAAGTHRIRQILPAGTRQSYPINGVPQVVTLSSGQQAANIAFSTTSLALISGTVYEDADDSGHRTSTEGGLSRWTVYVDNNRNGALDAGEPTTSTNRKGGYAFTIEGGNHQVRVVGKAGYRVTTPARGFQVADLGAGETINRLIGVSTRILITGNVFNDKNSNGIINSGENGLAGWRVWVDQDGDGVFDANEPNTLTEASGRYRINHVGAGSWRIQVLVPKGWNPTLPGSAARKIPLASGGTTSNKNFGMIQVT